MVLFYTDDHNDNLMMIVMIIMMLVMMNITGPLFSIGGDEDDYNEHMMVGNDDNIIIKMI